MLSQIIFLSPLAGTPSGDRHLLWLGLGGIARKNTGSPGGALAGGLGSLIGWEQSWAVARALEAGVWEVCLHCAHTVSEIRGSERPYKSHSTEEKNEAQGGKGKSVPGPRRAAEPLTSFQSHFSLVNPPHSGVPSAQGQRFALTGLLPVGAEDTPGVFRLLAIMHL